VYASFVITLYFSAQQLENSWMDFHENWYGCYATGRFSKLSFSYNQIYQRNRWSNLWGRRMVIRDDVITILWDYINGCDVLLYAHDTTRVWLKEFSWNLIWTSWNWRLLQNRTNVLQLVVTWRMLMFEMWEWTSAMTLLPMNLLADSFARAAISPWS
jgi:hypothetical protein